MVCAGHSQPAWSPDGRRLTVATDIDVRPGQPPKRFGIAIIDLAKGTERPVVENPNTTGQDLFPRWSPDGRRLVFWRDRERAGGFETAVFIVDVNGSGLRQLTPWDMLAGDPDWSPDGHRILFTTHPLFEFPDVGQSELHTIRPDGTGLRRLTNYGPNGPRATPVPLDPGRQGHPLHAHHPNWPAAAHLCHQRRRHRGRAGPDGQGHLHPPGPAADALSSVTRSDVSDSEPSRKIGDGVGHSPGHSDKHYTVRQPASAGRRTSPDQREMAPGKTAWTTVE